uniref:Ig-like domain-containing protein n=2 Tax=Flavobacterium sp. TaxID=239 RepID=UPI00404AF40E
MKNKILKLVLLILFSLTFTKVSAQVAKVSYSAQVAYVTSTCQGSGGCSELGSDPEFTAKIRSKDNINTTQISTGCLQCDASSSSCTYAQNTLLQQGRENTSDILFGHIEAWEDDVGDRCEYTEYIDINFLLGYFDLENPYYDEAHMSEEYSYNFRQWDFPTSSSVFTPGPLWGFSNLHSFKLSCSWRYIGTDNLITPTCTTQTVNYTAGGVKSWSLALTAGLTYSFYNCTSGNNGTRLRLYASDGYTPLEVNTSNCSELVFTPTTTGTYYLEIFQVVNNVRSEVVQPGVLTYSTDVPFAPIAIAQTFCGPTTANSLVPAISSTKKWYASATSTTALATTDVLATGTYYVVSVGGGNCESERTPVNITVNPLPSAPTASAQSFCFLSFATTSDIVATGTDKKWYSVATGGSELGNFAFISTGTYYVSQTVNGCESTRTAVSVIVNSIDAPTASDYQPICSSSNPTIANLTAAGSNIKWYSAATGGTELPTTAAISQGNYYVSQTINGCESTRKAVYADIRTNNPPTSYAQSFCSVSNPTIASLIAFGIDLKWYLAPTGGTALATTTAISTGTYYVSQFDNGCESTRTAVSVTVSETPSAPTASSAQSVCSIANPTIANLTATGTDIKWYYSEIFGSALATTTPISSGLYYVSQTINGCESSRTTVYVTVTTAPSAPTASNQLFCSASNPTIANLVATGTAIKWYSAATGGTALASTAAISTGTYYVSQTTNTCESTRTAVSVTVGSTISAPTASAQSFCTASNPTVVNLTASGTNIKWYLASTGGTVLATTTTISTATYYVSQSASGCESTRTPVIVTVNTTLSAPTAYAQSFCTGTNPTVANLVTVVGLVNKWYLTNTGGTPLAASTPISTGTYYVSESSSGCESTRTPVSVTVNPSPSAPTASAQSYCSDDNRTIGHIEVTGTGFTRIYSTATGGTPLYIFTPLTTGTYYAAKFANGCESARIPVSITINATPAAPTASDQSFCSASNPTIADLTPSGPGLLWYSFDDLQNVTPSDPTTPLSSETYFLYQSINGCRSFATTVNVTVNTAPSIPVAASTVNYTVGDIATPLTANTPSWNGLLWYTTATGGSFTTTAPTPSTATVGSTSYWVSSTDSINGCESDRVEIVVNVNNIITNAPTTNFPTQVYTGNDKNLTTLQITGSNIKWYNAGTGGTLLPSTTLLVDETTYYASQTVSGVESTTRLAITVKKISENTQTILGNSTIANLVTTPSIGNNAQWFTVASGGTALAGTTLLTNGNYYVEQASLTGATTLGAGFSYCWGVAIQADGKILVADTFNNSIKRMNADGTGIVTLATGFNRPSGIAVQADGKIVVADFESNSIKRMNADGTGIVTLGAGFYRPRGVAIQADGQILVADTGNNAIKRIYEDGNGTVTIVSGIISPRGIAIQPDGKIIVAGSTTIKRMDSNGTNIVTLATGLGSPNKVAIQADGKIVIADGVNNAIKRMNADGSNIVTLVTGLNEPTDVAIQTDGKIVFADYVNAAIKRFSEGTTSNRVAVAVDIDVPDITSTQTNVLCNGSATGAINISTTGGTAPYTYNWSDGITTEDRTDLIAGTYSVTVTDANGINDTETITITQPNVLTSSITLQTNVTCYGAFDGSATISADGGTSGYTYSWAPSGGTSATITGRAAGDYTCTITDASGCTTTQLVTITQSNALTSSITSQTDVSCNGGSDGSATISASGGTPGYTYSWAPSGGTSATITGLTAGDYTCTITDALGCIKTQTVTIQSAYLNNAVAQFCGVLIASLKGATYQWYACPNTIIPGATSQTYTPTTVGDYKVVISLGDCTVTSTCITLSVPTAPSPQIICNSGTVANLTATGTGTLNWYSEATGGTALAASENLASGTYYVSQTGAEGCESESIRTAVVVSVNPLPAAPMATAQTFCNGAMVADLVAIGTGTIKWYSAATGGASLTTTASLATGTYYVSQTNTDGCESDRTSIEITINNLSTAPTVTTPVNYIVDDIATALTATSAGTGLMWYTTATGGTGSATAPTPNTATAGTTSYWVSSTSDAGCESVRVEIVVTVKLPATHLNFDGVNDFINLGTSSTLKPQFGLTVEFMAYHDDWSSITNAATLIGNTQSGGYAIGVSGNNLSAVVARNNSYGSVLKPLSEISPGWHHFVLTYNGVYLSFYMDGVFVNSNNAGAYFPIIYNASNSTIIGGESSGIAGVAENNRYFNGAIDDVRIWNIARTAAEISASKNCELQGNESGLLAYYKFNQGIDGGSNSTITSLTNSVSGGANGTLQNFELTGSASNWAAGSPISTGVVIPSVPTVTTPVNYIKNEIAVPLTATTGGTGLVWYDVATGGSALSAAPIPSTATAGNISYWVSSTNVNGCESARTEIVVTVFLPATHLNFDGVNDFITLPNETVFDFTNQMTVEFWMNSNVTPQQWDALVAKGDNSWRVALTAAGKINFAGSGGFGDVTSNTTVVDGDWHHVAVTYNGTNAIIYVDGILDNSIAGTGNISNSNFAVSIGENLQVQGRNYNGNLEEVRFWNVARTAHQVNGAKNCELQGNESGLVAYYKFNQGNSEVDNTTITNVLDATSNANHGSLANFAKNGIVSNFLAGSPITTDIVVPTAPTTEAQNVTIGATVADLVPAPSESVIWYNVASGGEALATDETLTAGTYYVLQVNENGCESERTSVAITLTYFVLTAEEQINVSCEDGITGSATVAVSGGEAPYTYSWSPSGGNAATASNLSVGNYTVTVIDANALSETLTFNITGIEAPAINANESETICLGTPIVLTPTVSSATVNESDGNSLQYNWVATNGGIVDGVSDELSLEVSFPGTYTLTVTDTNGCFSSKSITVNNQTTSPEVYQELVLCPYNNQNKVGYLYVVNEEDVVQWYDVASGGTALASTETVVTGTYYVSRILDGCESDRVTVSVVVTTLTVSLVSKTNVTCPGGSDGTATIAVSGGVGPYSISWNNGAVGFSENNLSAGTYYIVGIIDATGCGYVLAYNDPAVFSITITEPASLSGTIVSQTNISCFGGSTGGATVEVSGGATPYTYYWDNGHNTPTLSGVSAGVYNLYVIDANGCGVDSESLNGELVATVTITESESVLQLTPASQTNIDCFGNATGIATVNTATGGTAPYTYDWTGNPTGDGSTSISELTAGSYTCTVTDANGCTASTTLVITQPAILTASAHVTSTLDCNNDTNGQVTASVTGGTMPYSFEWSTGGTNALEVNLSAGTYNVIVTDANGCTSQASVTIENPELFVATGVVNNHVSCPGGNDGSATVNIDLNESSVSYLWSNGATTKTFTGLTAGTYSVNVTNSNGCHETTSVTITEPASLSGTIVSQTNISCFGGSTGGATVEVSGGATPYTYYWDNGHNTPTLSGVSAGVYNLYVIDANGCGVDSESLNGELVATVTITESESVLQLTPASQTNIDCFGNATGIATVNTATGGTAPYTYDWTGNPTGDGSTSISELTAGPYTCTVTDANGCTASTTLVITQPAILTASAHVTSTLDCNNASDGQVTASVTGGQLPYFYEWNTGGTNAVEVNLAAGTYSVIVTDANGCTAQASVTLENPELFVATGVVNNHVTCFGGNDGSATINTIGDPVNGLEAFTNYEWSNGATTKTVTALSAG